MAETKGDEAEVVAVLAAEGGGKVESAALPLSMVLVQVFTTVMLLLSKLALNAGMRPFVLLVYRNLIAAATVAPLALIVEREMMKKVNLVVWGWVSINASFGVVLAMGLYYYGLRATDAAYSASFLNLIPIVTFIVAIALRAERLTLSNWPGKTKLLGTLMCVGGAMMVGLLKGRLLHLWPTHLLRSHHHAAAAAAAAGPVTPPFGSIMKPRNCQESSAARTSIEWPAAVHRDMVSGTLFLCASCLSYALWFSVQARVAKVFPSKYWATMLTCLSGGLQSFVVGIFITTDKSAWKLSWDLQLLTVVYSGVFNTGITFVLISWAISRRGPTYPSMFNALSLIMTTVMDSVLLGTNIYLGSVLGTLLIILGMYAFLWGKGKELAAAEQKQKQAATATCEQEESQAQQQQRGDDIA